MAFSLVRKGRWRDGANSNASRERHSRMRISDPALRLPSTLPARPVTPPAVRRLIALNSDSFSPSPLGDPNAQRLLGLSRGATGADGRIKQLQDDLIRAGFLGADVKSNSGYGNTFGPHTEAALKDFQKAYGLPQTGRVDAATAAALGGASTPPVTPPPVTTPTGAGVATSVDQANQSFLSQWGPTPFNSARGAPYGYEDCGPTSTAMALSQLGLLPHPSPAGAETTIDQVRDQALGFDSIK